MAEMLDEALLNHLKIAHGVMASLAWVIFFPAGAISIRLWHNRWTLWLHGIAQVLAYLLYTIGVMLGLVLTQMLVAVEPGLWMNYHPIIGLIIFGLAFLQPILGFVHHAFFKKVKRRTFWAHAHLWIGRILITAGIINGGLGLYITEGYQWDIKKGEIVYGVVAGTVWIVYVAAAVFGEIWKRVGTDVPVGEVVPVATGKVERRDVVGSGRDVEGEKAQGVTPSDSDSEGVTRSDSGAYRTYGYGGSGEMDEKPFRGRPSVLSERSADMV